VVYESESKTYEACSFVWRDEKYVFRVGKTTPKKAGQFVTIWKRDELTSETMPWEATDEIDYAIIYVYTTTRRGVFLFPKKVLIQKGLMKTIGTKGKRGTRIYAPWEIVSSPLAKRTQDWQAAYFIEYDEKNGWKLMSLIDCVI